MQKTFALATLAVGTLIAVAAEAAVLPGAAPVAPDATPQQARRALESVGFSQITALRQSGNIVRAVALYQGEPVRLVLDTRTGRISDDTGAPAIAVTPATGDAAVRAQLASLGYTGLGAVDRRGNIWTVPAQRGPNPVTVRVNALTGRVTDGSVPLVQHIAARDDMDTGYVAQQLRLLGYDRVGVVTRSGNVYRADVSRAGVPARVRIDGMTGAVTR
ncbi:hypothetical protein [Desertibaculum subflavum]|uniref:hypothetical protein n=1 Tax=Desertibaculum subflavum TaxID=2268458 RepID=UPI0013C516EB